jgi:hypothetical protein
MGSLLRADWLRIRRRWDVWIIVLGIPVLALLSYVAGAVSSGNNGITPVSSGDIPPEFQQQLAAQAAAQAAAQQAFGALPYQFPRSIATMTGGAIVWLLIGSAYLAASLLGNEFAWGTIRNVALFRPDRLRYLGARLVWLLGLVLLTFGTLVVLGAIAPAVIRIDPGNPAALTQDPSVVGMFVGPTAAVSFGGALLVTGSLLCAALAGMALAGVASLEFRSPAMGILGAGIYVVVEGIASSLFMARATGDLRYVPQMALTIRLSALINDAQNAAGLGTGGIGPTNSAGWVSLPPLAGAAILAAWLLGLFGLWFVIFRRADINE